MNNGEGVASNANTDNDPLFAPYRLQREACLQDPLIVVGLPRSGSSFLSHILSQIPDWYVFDDLYLHRKAKELRVKSPLTSEDLNNLMHFLGWQIRARLRVGLYAIPNVKTEEIPAMDDAIKDAFNDYPGSWSELQEEWMRRLAHRAGCTRWGYKMPGAFRYIPELKESYPNARFMFIMRNPYKVLASYKHMPKKHQDGDPRRYHPLAYAIYWRMAVRSYLKHERTLSDGVILVKFEELVSDPQETVEKISNFLGSVAPKQVLAPEKPNTSFKNQATHATLTGLETWLISKIAKQEITALGYESQDIPIKTSDFGDFVKVTIRFVFFHLRGLFNARR